MLRKAQACIAWYTVTFISPCPAKGLAVVLRLALMFANIQFLCVSTGWTKTLHEVQLRAHPNITIVAGTDNIEEIYRQTAVLLMPSLWQESFGLVAVEAQLRGIPVVSTAACGLREANFLEENCGPDCQIAPKKRSSDLVLGKTCAAMKVLRDPELYLSEENDDDTFDILMHLQGNWYCESDGQLVGSVSGSLITWIRPWVPTSGVVGSRMPNESEAHVALEMEGHVLIGQVCLETQKSIVWNNGQELQVQNVRLVHDSRTREMLRGITMEDAELTLNPLRPGHDSTKGSRWYVHVAHTIVATEAEAAGFAKLVQSMTFQDDNTSEALPESGGQLSKPLTVSGIHRQRRLGAKVVPRFCDAAGARRKAARNMSAVTASLAEKAQVMADYDVSSMSDAQVPSQQHCREELAWRSKVLNGKGDDAAGNVLVV
ncbi:unnamed protein product [Symbiodinium sp. KB8]|nr:unnamed protein product [Symbiodinium sp. KB8]